jgi:hypothetical protein
MKLFRGLHGNIQKLSSWIFILVFLISVMPFGDRVIHKRSLSGKFRSKFSFCHRMAVEIGSFQPAELWNLPEKSNTFLTCCFFIFLQPGYVIVNQDGAELAGWRQTPTDHNIGGALDRPIPCELVSGVSLSPRRAFVPQTSHHNWRRRLSCPGRSCMNIAEAKGSNSDEYPSPSAFALSFRALTKQSRLGDPSSEQLLSRR